MAMTTSPWDLALADPEQAQTIYDTIQAVALLGKEDPDERS